MKTNIMLILTALMAGLVGPVSAEEISLASAPPVVVQTAPAAGDTAVDPALAEIRVTFSKAMQDGSWSWSTWGEENFPEMVGQPKYLADGRTCVAKVKLQPAKFYAIWLNSDKFKNFKDADGRPAVPYLLTFTTASQAVSSERATEIVTQSIKTAEAWLALLNDDQRAVLAWTDRQFRSYFDARTFAGWSDQERVALETRCRDALKGPRSRDYYQAINTLGALRSTNGLPALRAIAYERADKNNRDRWMAIRSLGLIADKADVPELIRLVYHGNINTRWWAQLSLVRITCQNFGKDWNAWAKWWDASGGQPAYKPEIIRWWDGQVEPDKLAQSLDDNDQKFFADLKAKAASTQTVSPNELAAKLRAAEPTMTGIRDNWTAVRAAIDGGDSTNALGSLRQLAPYMREFREKFQGTSLEAGTTQALELVKSLSAALEKGDKDAAQITLDAMNTLGRNMEEQIKTINESAEPGYK